MILRNIKNPNLLFVVLLFMLPIVPVVYLSVAHFQVLNQNIQTADYELSGIDRILELLSLLREAKTIINNKDSAPYGNSLAVNLTVPEKRFESFKKSLITENKFGKNLTQLQEGQEIFKMSFKDFLDTRSKNNNQLERIVNFISDQSGLILDPSLDSYYLMDAIVVKYSKLFSTLILVNNNYIDQAAKQKIIDSIGQMEASIVKAQTFLSEYSVTRAELEVLNLNLELFKTEFNGLKLAKDQKEIFVHSKKIEDGFNLLGSMINKRIQYLGLKTNLSIFITLLLCLGTFSLMILLILRFKKQKDFYLTATLQSFSLAEQALTQLQESGDGKSNLKSPLQHQDKENKSKKTA